MEIIFIRHAQTNVQPNVPIPLWSLSKTGGELAQLLAQHALVKKLDILYTSSQTNALETALILAKPNAIPVKVIDDLIEISSFTRAFEKDTLIYEQHVRNYYKGKMRRINDGETKDEA